MPLYQSPPEEPIRPLRILMISDVYFPRINGVSTSIQTFSRALRQEGHRVTLIAPAYPAPRTGHSDEDIIRIPSRALVNDPEDRMMKRRRIRQLLPRLRAGDYQLIHVQTPFVAHYAGRELARALGLPLLVSYHTFFEEYLHHYVPLLPRTALRWLARSFTRRQGNEVEALVAPSEAMRRVLLDYGIQRPIAVIPTGIEANAFVPGDGNAFKQRLGMPRKAPTLVHVGRIAHEKNIGFLLDVMAQLLPSQPEAQLIIAGEGPALRELQDRARTLGLDDSIRFVGYLDRDKALRDCYAAGDIFLFASRTETQGLVLLEAMAQGLPLVSTAVMGTRDIVLPERGALALPEEAGAFARAIDALLQDPERRTRMSQEAGAFARRWSVPVVTGQLVELYHRLIEHSAIDASRVQGGLDRPVTNSPS